MYTTLLAQLVLLLLHYCVQGAEALAETDCISYACDPSGSGHNPRHNISPDLLQDPGFGILWNRTFLEHERFYAQPLVYTPEDLGGARSVVFTASTRNVVRTLDAATGELVRERLLENPVLEADVGCKNIPFYYGITGTPVIDPATDTVYLFAKGYRNNDQSGGFLNITYKCVMLAWSPN